MPGRLVGSLGSSPVTPCVVSRGGEDFVPGRLAVGQRWHSRLRGSAPKQGGAASEEGRPVTVVNVFIGQPKPGRYEDALELNRAAKKVLERHGAKNHRILVGSVSSSAYGTIVNSSEFDDLEAWGAFYDGVMADEELLALVAQAQGANTPYATQSVSVATEIPMGRKRGANGNVVVAFMSVAAPGRLEAAIALGGQFFDLVERHGARNCRGFQQPANGVLPDVLVAVMEFDNMRAYGKAMNSLMSDPAGQSIIELTQGSDSPIKALSTDIYTEIAG